MNGRQPSLLGISVFLASIIKTSEPGLAPTPFNPFSALLSSVVLNRDMMHSTHTCLQELIQYTTTKNGEIFLTLNPEDTSEGERNVLVQLCPSRKHTFPTVDCWFPF